MTHLKRAALALVVGLATMGSDCINEPFLVSVNLEELELTISIPAGTTTTFNGSAVVTAADYAATFASLQNMRIYDITVQGVGTYTGTVTGAGTVNGITIIAYTGPWSQFATPQSLLAGATGVTLNAAGVTALRNAVEARQTVTVAGAGSVSTSPVPALQLIVRIFAQVDAEP